MARPTKCTNGTKARIFEALRQGSTRASAAAAGGVTYNCLRNWFTADPDLRDEIEIAEEEAVRKFEAVILKASDENWTAAAWWLERRRSREYAKKEQLTLRKLEQMSSDDLIEFIAGGTSEASERETAGDSGS